MSLSEKDKQAMIRAYAEATGHPVKEVKGLMKLDKTLAEEAEKFYTIVMRNEMEKAKPVADSLGEFIDAEQWCNCENDYTCNRCVALERLDAYRKAITAAMPAKEGE